MGNCCSSDHEKQPKGAGGSSLNPNQKTTSQIHDQVANTHYENNVLAPPSRTASLKNDKTKIPSRTNSKIVEERPLTSRSESKNYKGSYPIDSKVNSLLEDRSKQQSQLDSHWEKVEHRRSQTELVKPAVNDNPVISLPPSQYPEDKNSFEKVGLLQGDEPQDQAQQQNESISPPVKLQSTAPLNQLVPPPQVIQLSSDEEIIGKPNDKSNNTEILNQSAEAELILAEGQHPLLKKVDGIDYFYDQALLKWIEYDPQTFNPFGDSIRQEYQENQENQENQETSPNEVEVKDTIKAEQLNSQPEQAQPQQEEQPRTESNPYLYENDGIHYYYDASVNDWIQYDPNTYTPFAQGNTTSTENQYDQRTQSQHSQKGRALSAEEEKTIIDKHVKQLLKEVLKNEKLAPNLDQPPEEISTSLFRPKQIQLPEDPADIYLDPLPHQQIEENMKKRVIPGKLNPLFLLKLTQKIVNKDEPTKPKEEEAVQMVDRPMPQKKKGRTQKQQDL